MESQTFTLNADRAAALSGCRVSFPCAVVGGGLG